MRSHIKTLALIIFVNFAFQVSASSSIFIDSIEYEAYDKNYARIKNSLQDIAIADILAKIKIDNQEYIVDSIADRAFFNCKMTSVSIPNTVTSIGEKAFYGCKGLTSLDIPSSVTYIGENAFEKCTSIQSVSISASLPKILESTFYDCFSINSINIPPSVNYIGKSSFCNCHAMRSVAIPNTVDSIGEYAFYACDALKTVTIPSNVKKIGKCAFWNCSSLESVTLSSSVAEIKEGTFYGCKSLASVIIPSSVTYIGERAFEQCEKLPFVVIPPYVTTIDEDAFKNCLSLAVIASHPSNPPYIGRNAFYRMPSDATIYVPAVTLAQYPTAEGWNEFHDFRALGSIDITISSSEMNLHIGENEKLTASVDKAYDVTILSEEWTTSDPEVAVVNNGFVSAVGEGRATISFIVIDGTGCPHIASCDVYVDGISGIKGIEADDSHAAPTQFYNLNGILVNSESLAPGLYIKKEGKRSVKILVKQ